MYGSGQNVWTCSPAFCASGSRVAISRLGSVPVQGVLYTAASGPKKSSGRARYQFRTDVLYMRLTKRRYCGTTTDTLMYMYIGRGGWRRAWMVERARAGGGRGTITAWHGGEEEGLGYSGWRVRDYIPTKRGEDGGGARTKTRRTVRPRSETRRVQRGRRGHGEARSTAAQREVS